jgi:thiol-disulfide isomerase/thioredoxin
MNKAFAWNYRDKSVSYQEFRQHFEQKVNQQPDPLDQHAVEYHHYYQLNWQRSLRVEKVYTPSEQARNILAAIAKPQTWIVITEGWCGDSSQIMPILAALAALNPHIHFMVAHRDQYPELIDAYKTDGKLGIPKLVAMDEQGNELWTWGPRPAEAVHLFHELKEQNLEKQKIYEALHLWYARNKGAAIEKEIVDLAAS